MMAGGAVQQNGIFSNPHHHNQQPHMESDPPDSRKRPLETPTEASSTKRTNTGGKSNDGDAGSCGVFGQCCCVLSQAGDNQAISSCRSGDERCFVLNTGGTFFSP